MFVDMNQLQNLGVEIGVGIDNGKITVHSNAKANTKIYSVKDKDGKSKSPAVQITTGATPAKKDDKKPKKCDPKKDGKDCDKKKKKPVPECDPKKDKHCSKDGKKIKKCGSKSPESPGFFKKIGISLGLNKKPLPQCKEYKVCEKIDKKADKKKYDTCIRDIKTKRK